VNDLNGGTQEFVFDLQVEDGWPPVAKEGLHFTPISAGYRLETAPFFVSDLSVGDVLKIDPGPTGNVLGWRRLRRSKRSTVWIKAEEGVSVESVLDQLKALMCNIERLRQFNYYAVDVPEECSAEQLDECLDQLDSDSVFVAYPSFRHG